MSTFAASPSNWTNNSDANFRAWGSYIAAQLLAVGWVQTADSGQINWATVTAPSGFGNFPGYEIWRMNDALQATAPVYVKIEYGESSANADGPAVRISFGSGSDGAGNLTGTTSTPLVSQGASVTTSFPLRGSGDSSRFVILFDYTGGGGFFFSIERSKDATGADTAEAVIYLYKTGTSGAGLGIQAWDTTLGTKSGNPFTGVGALFPNASSFASGSQIGVAPIMPEKPIFMNPILGAVGYYTGDITTGNTFVAYMYGVAHQYYGGNSALASGIAFRGAGGGTEALAIRYE